MNRRCSTVLLIAALATVGVATPGAIAQDTTVASRSAALYTAAELGLPEIEITIAEDGFQVPAEITAGRYLVTITNPTELPDLNPNFWRLSPGDTIDDANAMIQAANDAEANPPASPPAEDPMAFLQEETFAGGIDVPPGTVRQAIIDLEPGLWAVWDWGLGAALLSVTGETPVGMPEPNANATITATGVGPDFRLRVDGAIGSGRQIIKIVNDSDAIRGILIARAPIGFTLQAATFFEIYGIGPDASPNPARGLPRIDDMAFPDFTGLLSRGMTQWYVTDFAPGSHALIIWLSTGPSATVTEVS